MESMSRIRLGAGARESSRDGLTFESVVLTQFGTAPALAVPTAAMGSWHVHMMQPRAQANSG